MPERALEGLRVVECGDRAAATSTTCAPATTMGQDNEYVFGELLGMSGQQIAELTERQVIF